MITIKDLRVDKNGGTICSVPELAIEAGERVEILGPNGSGKTTLLRVLAGLESDFQGECQVGVTPAERVYVHQAPYLFRGSVLWNATYGLRARGFSRAESERLAKDWLAKLGLEGLADRRGNHLSGGERRRVALVRAMILRPRLLLLDEPLADMDEAGTACVHEGLRELRDSTVLVASPQALPDGVTTRTYRMAETCPLD